MKHFRLCRPSRWATWIASAGAVLAAAALCAQQGPYTAADVEEGARLFLANCAECHGPEGNAVPGIDLGHGRFRRAYSDDDLVDIVRRGIAGTAMPPGAFSNAQAAQIVAYLRSLAVTAENAAVAGDPERGRALFEGKGECLSCHRVNGRGSRLGPDLSDVGQFRRASDLRTLLVEPGRPLRPENRRVRVVTRDGATVTGRLLNHDSFTLQMIDTREQLRTFQKAALREFAIEDPPPMPSYRGRLTDDEITDLVRYLVSLTGVKESRLP